MSPQEIISQQKESVWNEINIDTQKEGMQVKGVLVTRKSLKDPLFYNILKLSKENQIPVFVK